MQPTQFNPGPVPAQGTPEYQAAQSGLTPYNGTGAFITVGGKNYSAPVAASAPSNAAQINQVGNPQIPQLSPYYGNTAPASAATEGVGTSIDLSIKGQQEAAAQAKANADALAAQNVKARDSITSLIGSTPAQTARQNAQNQTGINPTDYFNNQQALITQIGSLQKDYNDTKAAMDSAVTAAQANDTGALTGAVNANVTRIQKAYATQLSQKSANINAQAAVLQALQGNFNSAQQFVQQAVSDATADQKYNVDLLSNFISQNNTEISRLDSTYQNGISLAYKEATDQYNNDRQQANDYYDNMLKEAQTNAANANTALTVGGGKFTSTQVNTGASNAGMSTTDFSTLSPDVKNYYVSAPAAPQKAMNDLISGVTTGTTDKDTAISTIDSSNLSPAVKDYFKAKINAIKGTTSTTSTNYVSKAWNAIASFFSR